MSPLDTSSNEEWTTCEQGELASLARRTAQRHRREFLRRTSGAAVLAVVLSATLSWRWLFAERKPPSSRHFLGPIHAGIACGEVVHLAPQFVAGSLSQEKMTRILEHIGQCESCAATINEYRANLRELEA